MTQHISPRHCYAEGPFMEYPETLNSLREWNTPTHEDILQFFRFRGRSQAEFLRNWSGGEV